MLSIESRCCSIETRVGVMYLDQFSSPIILPELQYPLEADSSEEGIQFAILFELSARYESSANVPPHIVRSPPCLEHHKKTHPTHGAPWVG